MSKGDFLKLNKKTKPVNSVENFVNQAAVDGEKALNPSATRDFKSLRLGLNEYEYLLLKKAAENSGMSLIGYVRSAWVTKARKEV